MKVDLTRRDFVKLAGVGTSLAFAPGCMTAGLGARKGNLIAPDQKLRIACVGCGGKGKSDIAAVATERIVALCDVDDVQAKPTFDKYPDVPKYKDFRVMLEEMDDQIDAVTVSTPDHMHYAVAIAAIERGKHVFVQKPMGFSVGEARALTLAARRHNVVTVMGNQGRTKEGCRLVKEWVDAGILGDVREVHCWTKKLEDGQYRSALRGELASGQPVPDTLDWDLWVGNAAMRPYSDQYVPYKWRGWWGIGNGAMGDIGCHTMDAPFYALNLGAPIAVTAETSGYNEYTYPDWSIITYEFGARGDMPPVKLVWYDGGKLPEPPVEMEGKPFNKGSGFFIIGDKCAIYNPKEKGESPIIIPSAKRAAVRDSLPPKTIPRVEGGPGPEWVRACKGGPRCGSNFDYAGPLTETVLLGNLAIRANGKRILWDAEKMEVTNMPELNQYVNLTYRKF